jgi:hypothetical protein
MDSLARPYPEGYGFGLVRADDIPSAGLRYEPLGADDLPITVAPRRVSTEDQARWHAAEMADHLAGRSNW